MAADYFVHLACAPKLALGSGDAQRGTWVLLKMLKAGHYAALLQQHAKQKGQSPAGMSLTIGSVGPGGSGGEKSVTYEEPVSQNSRLEAHASACVGCPASFGHPFGCYSSVSYPISPEFLPAVPRAKCTLAWGEFAYWTSAEKSHTLMYVGLPPCGRQLYHSEQGRWTQLD